MLISFQWFWWTCSSFSFLRISSWSRCEKPRPPPIAPPQFVDENQPDAAHSFFSEFTQRTFAEGFLSMSVDSVFGKRHVFLFFEKQQKTRTLDTKFWLRLHCHNPYHVFCTLSNLDGNHVGLNHPTVTSDLSHLVSGAITKQPPPQLPGHLGHLLWFWKEQILKGVPQKLFLKKSSTPKSTRFSWGNSSLFDDPKNSLIARYHTPGPGFVAWEPALGSPPWVSKSMCFLLFVSCINMMCFQINMVQIWCVSSFLYMFIILLVQGFSDGEFWSAQVVELNQPGITAEPRWKRLQSQEVLDWAGGEKSFRTLLETLQKTLILRLSECCWTAKWS